MRRSVILAIAMVFIFSGLCLAGDVYVSKQGKRYHEATCRLLKTKEPQVMDEKEAIEKGLKPCKVCIKDESSGTTGKGTKRIKATSK